MNETLLFYDGITNNYSPFSYLYTFIAERNLSKKTKQKTTHPTVKSNIYIHKKQNIYIIEQELFMGTSLCPLRVQFYNIVRGGLTKKINWG